MCHDCHKCFFFGKCPSQAAVVSYPKSGRTWLRVAFDVMGQPQMLVHDDTAPTDLVRWQDLRTTKDEYRQRKVVFLVRDPRDTLVSAYFHATKREPVFDGTISEFVRHEQHGILKLLRFHTIWNAQRDVPVAFHLVRYEDLHADSYSTLRRIVNFLDLDVCEQRIGLAAKFCKFSNLRQLEQSGFFERRGYGEILTPRDKHDSECYKMRRGAVGGYRRYLSPEDVLFIDDRMSEYANPFYGRKSDGSSTNQGKTRTAA